MNTIDRINSLKFSKRVPTLEEFRDLRINAGWRLPSDPMITDALSNTIFGVCVENTEGATIGMGRIVGDRGLQIFITDLIVHKEWQNKGIGTKIMKLLMEYVECNTSPATFVGLFAAFGRHGFYEKFDFISRPNETLGPGMVFFPKRTRE